MNKDKNDELTCLEKLEWTLMTLRDKLTFGMSEEEGIKFRERRVEGVLIDAVEEITSLKSRIQTLEEMIIAIYDGSIHPERIHHKYENEINQIRLKTKDER